MQQTQDQEIYEVVVDPNGYIYFHCSQTDFQPEDQVVLVNSVSLGSQHGSFETDYNLSFFNELKSSRFKDSLNNYFSNSFTTPIAKDNFLSLPNLARDKEEPKILKFEFLKSRGSFMFIRAYIPKSVRKKLQVDSGDILVCHRGRNADGQGIIAVVKKGVEFSEHDSREIANCSLQKTSHKK